MKTSEIENRTDQAAKENEGSSTAINWSSTVGSAIGTIADFLSSCKGNCWNQYPPFSGTGAQRGACFTQCEQLANQQPGGGGNGGGFGLQKMALPLLGLGALAIYAANKK